MVTANTAIVVIVTSRSGLTSNQSAIMMHMPASNREGWDVESVVSYVTSGFIIVLSELEKHENVKLLDKSITCLE